MKNLTSNAADTLALYYRGATSPTFAETSDGGVLMNGIGVDIWGTADAFRFAYKTLNGNGTLVARVDSLYQSNTWAKAGVMIRQKTEPGSLHAFMAKTPSMATAPLPVAADSRSRFGEHRQPHVSTTATFPYWVKVQKMATSSRVISRRMASRGPSWANRRRSP